MFEGGKGPENGQFDFPRGMTVDASGNVLIADTNNGRIQKFSPSGMFLGVIGTKGEGLGEFRQPCGVAVDSSGNIYVADTANQRVQKLMPNGTFVAEWKGPELSFYGPSDVSIGNDGAVYVVDEGHARIVKLDTNGTVLAVWGEKGTGDGQFNNPTSVAVDANNDRDVRRRSIKSANRSFRYEGEFRRQLVSAGVAADTKCVVHAAFGDRFKGRPSVRNQYANRRGPCFRSNREKDCLVKTQTP